MHLGFWVKHCLAALGEVCSPTFEEHQHTSFQILRSHADHTCPVVRTRLPSLMDFCHGIPPGEG